MGNLLVVNGFLGADFLGSVVVECRFNIGGVTFMLT